MDDQIILFKILDSCFHDAWKSKFLSNQNSISGEGIDLFIVGMFLLRGAP